MSRSRAAKAMLKLKLKKAPIPEWGAAELGVGEGARRMRQVALEALPPRQVETRDVDAGSEAALAALLRDIR